MNDFNKRVLIVDLFALLLVLAMFLCLLQIRTTSSNIDTKIPFKIATNLSLKPIKSIEVIEASKGCPKGTVSLINDSWNGIVEGCYCETTFTVGPCSASDLENKCSTVLPQTRREIHNWNKWKFCLIPWAQNYFDLNVKTTCDEKESDCGIIDSLGQHLCVDVSTECPINSLSFVETSVKTEKPTNEFVLTERRKLIYSNKPDSKANIMIGTAVSEGLVCSNPFYKNNSPPYYPLDYNFVNERHNCFEGLGKYVNDNNVLDLDSISLLELLSDNGLQDYIEKLPEVKKYFEEKKVHLYANTYYGISENLLKEINETKRDLNRMLEDMKHSKSLKLDKKTEIEMTLLSLFTVSIILLIGKLVIFMQFYNPEVKRVRLVTNYLLGLIFAITLLISLVGLFGSSSSTKKFDWMVSDVSQVDEIIYDLLNTFIFSTTDILLYYFGITFIAVITVALPFYEYYGDSDDEYVSLKLSDKTE